MNGVLHVYISPGELYSIGDVYVADGQWHHVKIVCETDKPVKNYLDGAMIREYNGTDRSDFGNFIRINLGWTRDLGDEFAFNGSIRNFVYKPT